MYLTSVIEQREDRLDKGVNSILESLSILYLRDS